MLTGNVPLGQTPRRAYHTLYHAFPKGNKRTYSWSDIDWEKVNNVPRHEITNLSGFGNECYRYVFGDKVKAPIFRIISALHRADKKQLAAIAKILGVNV